MTTAEEWQYELDNNIWHNRSKWFNFRSSQQQKKKKNHHNTYHIVKQILQIYFFDVS